MCSRLPLHLQLPQLKILPPANKPTQGHKEQAKDHLLAIKLLLSQSVANARSV